ncbi:hypothetical protein NX722_27270 [Endozoicomonas gorgoniicola]|uniref:Uncharacterized protein n=1 Tax=Endozoicomonas gorgoniicola TaxID=1234144 RepID=A0ABT3N3Q6_9GAMM|nr:hypothetical protein [Endozoicomonas gorgoniicola]MCW7556264.1 hypothetical protein [Endozoicomonas gorgoniicola]
MRCVPLTSYGFLQTQPLASYALAIQIAFPSVGAAQASFSLTGLPASLGKQKKRLPRKPAVLFVFNICTASLCQPAGLNRIS